MLADVLYHPRSTDLLIVYPEGIRDLACSPFYHLEGVRMARNVGVYRHGEAKVFVRLVEVVKVVFPEILDYAGVDPAVGVGHVLDEHLPRGLAYPRKPTADHAMQLTMGGRSSRYQLAGISTRPVVSPRTSGFIHVSGCFL